MAITVCKGLKSNKKLKLIYNKIFFKWLMYPTSKSEISVEPGTFLDHSFSGME